MGEKLAGFFSETGQKKVTPIFSAEGRKPLKIRVEGYIGFIASMTTPFCERCDRVTITSDGKFKVCLHSPREYQLDASMSDEQLIQCIKEELLQKPESHGGIQNILGNGNRPMIGIGG